MNALYRFGFMLRETGQALDRLGSTLQGQYAFREQCEGLQNQTASLIRAVHRENIASSLCS